MLASRPRLLKWRGLGGCRRTDVGGMSYAVATEKEEFGARPSGRVRAEDSNLVWSILGFKTKYCYIVLIFSQDD